MVGQAIIIGLVSTLVYMESRIGGQHMLDRPIIIAPIIGLIMGDFQTGLVIGGTLELVWIGAVGIGTAVPPDVVVGSALATAFTIYSGEPVEAGLALAIPIASLAQLVNIGVNIVNGSFVHGADRAAARGDTGGVERGVWYGAGLYFISKFLVVTLGYLLGADVFANLVSIIPAFVMDGLGIATGFLPALGMAMLMRITLDRKFNIFLLIGFLFATYFQLNTMAIALFGLSFAVLYFMLFDQQEEADY